MKNIFKWFNINKHLLICLYLVTLLCYVLNGIWGVYYNNVLKQSQQELTFDDFELVNLQVLDETTLISTSNDPQMIYTSTNSNITSIYYCLENSAIGVINAYYTLGAQEDYSNLKRLAPNFGQSKSAFYIIPEKEAVKIRLDLGSLHGQKYVFSEITLNKNIPFWRNFALTNRQVIYLSILPLMLNAIIIYIYKVVKNYINILKEKKELKVKAHKQSRNN